MSVHTMLTVVHFVINHNKWDAVKTLACQQALHLGGYREKYTCERHARGDATAGGVLARLASLAQIGRACSQATVFP